MNPFEGWLVRRKVNRSLSDLEQRARLDIAEMVELLPVDRGVIKLNSSFLEYTDRHFFLRGWALMGGIPLFLLGLIGFVLFGSAMFTEVNGSSRELSGIIVGAIVALIFLISAMVCFQVLLRKDMFSLTYFPIRFDRNNRKVHAIIRGKWGKPREISISWKEAFFYIAPVGPPRPLSTEVPAPQLHCHVLDVDGITVRETFAIGNSCASPAMALQHWEMIRRFMEEGADSLPYPPLEIYMSTKTSLRNAMLMHVAGSGDGLLRIFAMIFTVPWAICRYLAMLTCRAPKWSREVEAATRVERGDPSIRREPTYMGQFQAVNRSVFASNMQYRKEAEQAERDYMALQREADARQPR